MRANSTYDEADEIRAKYETGEYTQAELAAEYGYTSRSSINKILTGKRRAKADIPEPNHGWEWQGDDHCASCGIRCDGELCPMCERELAAGIRYEDTTEDLVKVAWNGGAEVGE